MEQPNGVKFPAMVVINRRLVPVDHVLELDTSAFESHKTVVVITTTGHLLVHDGDAAQLMTMFGLTVEAKAPEPERTGKRGNKAA